MYSRKNSGYFVSSPPPNYTGVAFDRSFRPSSEIEQRSVPEETKDEEKREEQPTGGILPEEVKASPQEEHTPATELEEDLPESDAGRKDDLLSLISEKEFKLEDMLLIGAVLLFVSGELDGDIMLLLGLLLVAGI